MHSRHPAQARTLKLIAFSPFLQSLARLRPQRAQTAPPHARSVTPTALNSWFAQLTSTFGTTPIHALKHYKDVYTATTGREGALSFSFDRSSAVFAATFNASLLDPDLKAVGFYLLNDVFYPLSRTHQYVRGMPTQLLYERIITETVCAGTAVEPPPHYICEYKYEEVEEQMAASASASASGGEGEGGSTAVPFAPTGAALTWAGGEEVRFASDCSFRP